MIKKLEADLKDWLSKSAIKPNDRRVAILGVGSDLRSDDVIGILVAQKVQEICNAKGDCRLGGFLGYAAPENITGEILAYKPTHLIIIDAADLNIKPGAAKIINVEDIGGVSFSTHQLPLKFVVEYIVFSTHCDVIVIGVQPKSLEVAKEPTEEILKASQEVVSVIERVILS